MGERDTFRCSEPQGFEPRWRALPRLISSGIRLANGRGRTGRIYLARVGSRSSISQGGIALSIPRALRAVGHRFRGRGSKLIYACESSRPGPRSRRSTDTGRQASVTQSAPRGTDTR